MKKRLKSLGIPAIVMFALAVVLLGGGVVGSTRAAVSYVSKEYSSTIEVPSIGITLLEYGNKATDGTVVGRRDYTGADGTMTADKYNDDEYKGWDTTTDEKTLLSWMTFKSENATQEENEIGTYSIGQKIPEVLKVQNSGDVDTYVRAIVYHYWTDSKGNKVQALDPNYIELEFNTEASGWKIDQEASTYERTVLYYKELLGTKKETPAFLTSVTISEDVKNAQKNVTVNGSTTTYTYNGMKFNLEAAVEAVQAENGAAAIKSAWGIDADWANDGNETGDETGTEVETESVTTTE